MLFIYLFLLLLPASLVGKANLDYRQITSRDHFSPEMISYIEKINGINQKFFDGKKLSIPINLAAAKDYCPLPVKREDFANIDSLIWISRSKNILGVYQKGFLIYWAPITRARKINWTPTGRFSVQSRSRLIISRKYDNAPMPFALHIIGNICIHQGPMVGYPASHGCIRLFKRDAIWLYNWARRGVTVIIE